MAVKPIPDGYHSVTPYLIIGGAARALEFYKRVFGAVEKFRMDGPDGRVGHAEIQIGDSHLMLADEHPERNIRGPLSVGGTSMSLLLYVEDVDTQFQKAIEAGAKETMPVQDQFYGDRSGTLTDPFGHVWTIATHKEDVSSAEMQRRIAAFTNAQGAA
jgi:PhnB protein